MVGSEFPTFGVLLKRHRTAAGLTQEALAERAGLSPLTISALERGINQAPRKDTVALLAQALHLSPQNRATLEAAARRGSSSAPLLRLSPSRQFTGILPPLHVDTRTMLLGVGVAALLGVVSGVLPAWQASRLRIVDALRRV